MKSISLLVLSTSVLITGVAIAQTTPSGSDANTMQSNAPASTMAPSAATDADQSSDAISQACVKQASDKKMSGDAKNTWVEKCKQGKTTRQDH